MTLDKNDMCPKEYLLVKTTMINAADMAVAPANVPTMVYLSPL